ncbi:MAG TPA: hypothetical protein VFG23_25990, partial [Polyangia bacterium]|nr:hypothetical protein [Polyangia bacterium]
MQPAARPSWGSNPLLIAAIGFALAAVGCAASSDGGTTPTGGTTGSTGVAGAGGHGATAGTAGSSTGSA